MGNSIFLDLHICSLELLETLTGTGCWSGNSFVEVLGINQANGLMELLDLLLKILLMLRSLGFEGLDWLGLRGSLTLSGLGCSRGFDSNCELFVIL